jgi:hypothetical protein
MKKALGLIVAIAASAAVAAPFDAWPQKTVVTVNTSGTGANVAGSVTNYPLLLRITDASLISASGTGGARLRFSSMDESVEYSYEIEYWNNTDTGIVWVRVPSIPGNTASSQFKIHSGNTGASAASNGADVFRPTDGWVAVWHMNKVITAVTDTLKDVTGNNWHAIPAHVGLDYTFPRTNVVGPAYAGTGNTNAAGRHFNVILSVNDTTAAGGFLSTDAANLTLSAWASSSNQCASGTRQTLIGKYQGTGTGAGERQLGLQNAGSGSSWAIAINPTTYYNTAGANEFVSSKSCAGITTNLAYIAGTYQGLPASRDVAGAYSSNRVYINGDSAGSAWSTASQTSTQIGRASPLRIGAGGNTGTPNRWVLGAIDEARISNVARSADWIKLDYETQRSAGNVAVTFGTPTRILPTGKTLVERAPISARVSGGNVVFSVSESSAGKLSVLDMQGRTVWSHDVSGDREVSWNGAGKGIFFARFTPKDAKVAYLDTKFSLVK